MESTGDYQNTIIVFSQEFFSKISNQMGLGGAEPWTAEGRFLATGPRRARELRSLVRRLLDYTEAGTGSFGLPDEASRRLEESLVCATVLAARQDDASTAAPDLEPSSTRRLRLVQTCLEYAEANRFAVTLAELCRVTGKSERTLRYAFLEHLGCPPAHYLRRWRLNYARRDLMAAAPGETTVTKIATHWGFYELGRFAADFRRFFGVLPSEALKQPPRQGTDRIPDIRSRG